jgi:hypothetical protein
MYKNKFSTIRVNVDIIRPDKQFHKIWNSVITKAFFVAGVAQFGIYTRPTGYMKDGYFYLLGHQCSVDALIDLGQEEIEVDIIEIADGNIPLFLILFLAKEHKNLKCTAELIRLILDYRQSADGKEWFKSVLNKGDKEDRIAALLDITKYEVKCYLLLLKEGNEQSLAMLAAGHSLNKAVECCKPVKKADKAKNVVPLNQVNTEESPVPDGGNAPRVIAFPEWLDEDEDIEFPEAVFDDPEDSEEFLQKRLAKYAKNAPVQTEDNTTHISPFIGINLSTADGGVLELSGSIFVTVDGKSINSTSQLVQLPDGKWQLPAGYKTFYLTVQALAA